LNIPIRYSIRNYTSGVSTISRRYSIDVPFSERPTPRFLRMTEAEKAAGWKNVSDHLLDLVLKKELYHIDFFWAKNDENGNTVLEPDTSFHCFREKKTVTIPLHEFEELLACKLQFESKAVQNA
jgi:hypothetical protein